LYLPLITDETNYFNGPLESEPNNSYLQANGPLIFGEYYYGLFNDQKDYYSIYLKDGGSISISLDNVLNRGVQLQLFYQDPRNGYVEIDTDKPFRIQHTGSAGWYYIYVAIDTRYINADPIYYFLRANYTSSSSQLNNSTTVDNNDCTTATPNATFTPTITPSPIPPVQVGFDFETGIEDWVTAEGNYKLAILDTTTQIKYSGNQSLRVTTQLKTSKDIYLHTEADAYFDKAIPEGMSRPGPYNLAGKQASCFVYLPQEMLATGYPKARIALLVKDVAPHFRNQWSDPIYITPSNVDKWFKISFTIGNGTNTDLGFDPTAVNTLGVRIDVSPNSGFSYTGPFYIDRCTIQ
jgi:hypothetical protein